MKRVRAVLAAAIAGAGLLASSSVLGQAPSSNWYAGVGVGSAKAKSFCDAGGLAGVTVTSCDDKTTGWKILGGYQLNKHLAFEAGFSSGSDFKSTALYMGTPISLQGNANILEATMIGMLPLGDRIALLAKFGVDFWDLKVEVPGIWSESDTGLGMTYGIGAQFDFTSRFGARAEWQIYAKVGNAATTGESDIDAVLASVYYRF